MKSLVVYYSRSNITKELAEDIASKTNADIEEIKSKVNYQGKIGYARAGKDALQEKIIALAHLPEKIRALPERRERNSLINKNSVLVVLL